MGYLFTIAVCWFCAALGFVGVVTSALQAFCVLKDHESIAHAVVWALICVTFMAPTALLIAAPAWVGR